MKKALLIVIGLIIVTGSIGSCEVSAITFEQSITPCLIGSAMALYGGISV